MKSSSVSGPSDEKRAEVVREIDHIEALVHGGMNKPLNHRVFAEGFLDFRDKAQANQSQKPEVMAQKHDCGLAESVTTELLAHGGLEIGPEKGDRAQQEKTPGYGFLT